MPNKELMNFIKKCLNNNSLKIIALLVLSLFTFTGCTDDIDKPFIVFSDKQITRETPLDMRYFKSGQRIYYGVINKRGFEDDVVKIMVFKQDDSKVKQMGYSYYSNREYRLKDKRYMLSYLTIHQKGHYIMQAFTITNLEKPVCVGEFFVVDK